MIPAQASIQDCPGVETELTFAYIYSVPVTRFLCLMLATRGRNHSDVHHSGLFPPVKLSSRQSSLLMQLDIDDGTLDLNGAFEAMLETYGQATPVRAWLSRSEYETLECSL